MSVRKNWVQQLWSSSDRLNDSSIVLQLDNSTFQLSQCEWSNFWIHIAKVIQILYIPIKVLCSSRYWLSDYQTFWPLLRISQVIDKKSSEPMLHIHYFPACFYLLPCSFTSSIRGDYISRNLIHVHMEGYGVVHTVGFRSSKRENGDNFTWLASNCSLKIMLSNFNVPRNAVNISPYRYSFHTS